MNQKIDIKIDNGYKLDRQMNMCEFMEFVDGIRDQVTQKCFSDIQNRVIRNFLYFYHYKELHGKDAVKKRIDIHELAVSKGNRKESKRRLQIWRCLDCGNYVAMFREIFCDIVEHLREEMHSGDNRYAPKLRIYPLASFTLLTFDGSDGIREIIESNEHLQDYHYHDVKYGVAPRRVSDNEWKKRGNAWKVAIGPDCIPENHGLEVHLFHLDTSRPEFAPMDQTLFPSEEEMIEQLLPTCDGITKVKGFPPSSEWKAWEKFSKSYPYRVWAEKEAVKIREKCNFVHTAGEFQDILYMSGVNYY